MALDRATGAVWVSDRLFAGLYRIDAHGELTEHPAALQDPGLVAADPSGAPVWVEDRQTGQVKWFRWQVGAGSLAVETADASFSAVGGLAPQGGGCWISDPAQGRLLYYHPQGARVEHTGLDRPGPLAAAADGAVWALTAGGDGLVRLDPAGDVISVSLGAAAGTSVDVDTTSGEVWVLGSGGVAVYDGVGRPLRQFGGYERPTDLAVSAGDGRVWVAGEESLWKLTLDGQPLARLSGFSGLAEVVVDPGAKGRR